jgi:bacterial/archaeal transporter family-2 protein
VTQISADGANGFAMDTVVRSRKKMLLPVALAVCAGIAAGALAGLQGPMTNAIGQRTSVLQAVWLVHAGGLLVASVLLLLVQGRPLPMGPVVVRAAVAGACGVAVLTAATFVVGRLGATATISLVVAGQFLAAILVDQFGLLDQPLRLLTSGRVAGVALLLAGTWLVLRR